MLSRLFHTDAQWARTNKATSRGFSLWHVSCTIVLSGCFYVGNPWIPDEIAEPYLLSRSPKTNTVLIGSVGALSATVASPASEFLIVEWYVDDQKTSFEAQAVTIVGDEAYQQFYIPKSSLDDFDAGSLISVEARLAGPDSDWVELVSWELIDVAEETQ